MADAIDLTQDRLELEEKLLRQYRQVNEAIQSTGFCLNCGEPVADKLRWCDKYCVEDYEKRLK